MTTIAYKDGVMACDSCWTYGGTIDVLATKISRLANGALLGQSGSNDGRYFEKLLGKVKSPASLPTHEQLREIRQDFLGLLVLPSGKIFKLSTTFITPENWNCEFDPDDVGLWEITGPFAAVGSGGDFAIVAMECGKSAKEAVDIACRFDPNSRGPIHSLSLKALK